MASLNSEHFIGNATEAPVVRYTQNGTAVTEFTLAINDTWTRGHDGAKQERTEWVPVVAWGRQAELAGQLITKGKQLFVEGRRQTDSWEDKNTGVKMYKTKCICHRFQLLGKREDGGARDDGGYEPDQDYDFQPGDFPDNTALSPD